MHLSFLLDLSGTCLSELIEHRTCSATVVEQSDKAPAIVNVFSKKKPGKGERFSLCIGWLEEKIKIILKPVDDIASSN